MHRLVYYSENRISGSQDEIRHQINEILAASLRNNDVVGVTGALMFSSGFFGQVLEGPSEAVEATFERIQQDVRHGESICLNSRQSKFAISAIGPWLLLAALMTPSRVGAKRMTFHME